jgi:hypothetical protein
MRFRNVVKYETYGSERVELKSCFNVDRSSFEKAEDKSVGLRFIPSRMSIQIFRGWGLDNEEGRTGTTSKVT